LNGYRDDNFKPYVFVSEDYGNSWKDISNNLPKSSVNVIKEDPKDENILYLGNDQGTYITFDKGINWSVLEANLPKVAVHDLVIQKRTNDLVIGTHGRSIYKTNIAVLQQYQKIKSKDLEILDLKDVRYAKNWGSSWNKWAEPNEPEFEIPFYTTQVGNKSIQIKTKDGIVVNTWEVNAEKGFNFENYDLTFSEKGLKSYLKKHKDKTIEKKKNGEYYLQKGEYKVVIGENSKAFKIK